jgi:hypothetical protein
MELEYWDETYMNESFTIARFLQVAHWEEINMKMLECLKPRKEKCPNLVHIEGKRICKSVKDYEKCKAAMNASKNQSCVKE